jgi:23S rRNA pseudouridine2605 synthase
MKSTESLSKYLAQAGVAARRKVVDLIKQGKVTVNGVRITEPGHKISKNDIVKIGKKIIRPISKVYILLNKPKGYITTVTDEKGRATVMDLVADAGAARLYPVGRLDKDTTGLLLITNDGELAAALAHPKNLIKKSYMVLLDKPLEQEHAYHIKKGIKLVDGFIAADTLSFVPNKAHNTVKVTIHSGKNRIVRRIFEHFGYEVAKLDRVSYAGLTKKGLPLGRWRFLKARDVTELKKIARLA